MADIGVLQVGDLVRVLPPFREAFPEIYPVEYLKGDGTCGICGDRDFHPRHLEKVA